MRKIIAKSKKFGQVEILVDDSDYDFLSHFTWSISWSGAHQSPYAVNSKTGKKMHRLLLGVTDPKVFVDHKDGNGLNNQRNNIRKSDASTNQINKKASGTSKYLGVHLQQITRLTKKGGFKTYTRWIVKITPSRGKQIHIGCFNNEIEAAKKYDSVASKFHGEFARLNFPQT